ncbi:MAG: hypothetical protein J6S85_04685 [Methanobrevibacter sp.]|nr:hypothetical protein [Methanobrevibacter sp.]
MYLIIRTSSIDDKNEIKELLQSNYYTDDSLFNNLLYIYNVKDVTITTDNYLIWFNTDFQIQLPKISIEYMSIKNEKE